MKKVIEWCTHHRADPPATDTDDSDNRKKSTDIDEWDQKFMQVDQEMLFEIILVCFHPLHPAAHPPRLTLCPLGRQLSRHQGAPGRWLQDRCEYDQGQVPGGD